MNKPKITKEQKERISLVLRRALKKKLSPEESLWFSVIREAIYDYDLRFLKGDMIQAQIIGLDPEYVRALLRNENLI
jgi:hypothetical protein